MVGAGAATIWIWLFVAIALPAGAGVASPAATRLSAGLRVSLGGGAVLLALRHLLLRPPGATGLIVDVLLLELGLWSIWQGRRQVAA